MFLVEKLKKTLPLLASSNLSVLFCYRCGNKSDTVVFVFKITRYVSIIYSFNACGYLFCDIACPQSMACNASTPFTGRLSSWCFSRFKDISSNLVLLIPDFLFLAYNTCVKRNDIMLLSWLEENSNIWNACVTRSLIYGTLESIPICGLGETVFTNSSTVITVFEQDSFNIHMYILHEVQAFLKLLPDGMILNSR